jgi:hypothetical protein
VRHAVEVVDRAHERAVDVHLRADGYQTLASDVTVGTGTTTVRLTLKKK